MVNEGVKKLSKGAMIPHSQVTSGDGKAASEQPPRHLLQLCPVDPAAWSTEPEPQGPRGPRVEGAWLDTAGKDETLISTRQEPLHLSWPAVHMDAALG